VVVGGDPTDPPWKSRLTDLRVDDHPQPLAELRRLYNVSRLYDRLDKATDVLDARPVTDEALDAARRLFDQVRVDLPQIPGNAEPMVWYAVGLANAGRLDEALPWFAEAYRIQPAWREVIPRLAGAELLNVDDEALRRILEA
jgi:tetratricopeptide (TPR) repeat protein